MDVVIDPSCIHRPINKKRKQLIGDHAITTRKVNTESRSCLVTLYILKKQDFNAWHHTGSYCSNPATSIISAFIAALCALAVGPPGKQPPPCRRVRQITGESARFDPVPAPERIAHQVAIQEKRRHRIVPVKGVNSFKRQPEIVGAL